MNKEKLDQLLMQFLQDLGGAFSVPLVRIGDSLGLYKTLHESGPMMASELANVKGLSERYILEWLSAQAASNYIIYDASNDTFSLTSEQAAILAIDNSPANLIGAFQTSASMMDNQNPVEEVFKSGKGVGWGDQSQCLACSVAKFFGPSYHNALIQEWLPSLDGVIEKLDRGIKVADVGCGHGISTMLMAEAFPNSEFIGFDFHDKSISEANAHANEHNLGNVHFEQALANEFPGKYELVTFFDCLHDLGDPVGTMAHVRNSIETDGTCMIVEPAAGNSLQENLNPVGRLYYSASTMICLPTSLSQEVGYALGAQAGEERIRQVVVEGGGFNSFHRATDTPFNMVLEARP